MGLGAYLQASRRTVRAVWLPLLGGTLSTCAVFLPMVYLSGELRSLFSSFAVLSALTLGFSLVVSVVLIPRLGGSLRGAVPRGTSSGRGSRALVLLPCQLGARHPRAAFLLLALAIGLPTPLLPDVIEEPPEGWLTAQEATFAARYNRTIGSDSFREVRRWLDPLLGGVTRPFLKNVELGKRWDFQERPEVRVWIQLPPGSGIERADERIRPFEEEALRSPAVERTLVNVRDRVATMRVLFHHEAMETDEPYLLRERLISQALQVAGMEVSVSGLVPMGFYSGLGQVTGFTVYAYGPSYERLEEISKDFARRLETLSPGGRGGRQRRRRAPAAGARGDPVPLGRRRHGPDRPHGARAGGRPPPAPLARDAGLLRRSRGRPQDAGADRHGGRPGAGPGNPHGHPAGGGPRRAGPARRPRGAVDREGPPGHRADRPAVPAHAPGPLPRPLPHGQGDARKELAWMRLPPGTGWSGPVRVLQRGGPARVLLAHLGNPRPRVPRHRGGARELAAGRGGHAVGPLAWIGVALAFVVMGQNFAEGAFIGGVLTVGISVNDSILLADAYRRLRLARVSAPVPRLALLAARQRLRPMWTTTLTSVAGMLPLLILPDAGNFWVGLAITVVGGLLSSTLLAPAATVALFSCLDRRADGAHAESRLDLPMHPEAALVDQCERPA